MVDMIDTWLLAAFCFTLLMLGALVRVVRTRNRHDRHLAALVAITIGSAAGLTLCIALGSLTVLAITIILALLCYAGLIAIARSPGGAGA
jgi:multisubunit Na+/H+ antiporter MnhF subunit